MLETFCQSLSTSIIDFVLIEPVHVSNIMICNQEITSQPCACTVNTDKSELNTGLCLGGGLASSPGSHGGGEKRAW